MRRVTMDALVPAADPAAVFATLADFARYPEFTDAVRQVAVATAEDGSLHSRWEVNFRNGVLRWAERDVLDPRRRVITFDQLDGDFDVFTGEWRVEAAGDDVIVVFDAEFDLGMPSLAPIIDPIAERALVENLRRILVGLLGPATTFSATEAAIGA